VLDESAVDAAHLRCRAAVAICSMRLSRRRASPSARPIRRARASSSKVRSGQRLPAGAFESCAHLLGRERLQHVHRSAREQRRIDFERRVFGRRADKGQQPAFDVGQESVLLRLVEAMHFIDEENRAPATAGARHFGACHRLTNVLDPREDRREGDEIGVERRPPSAAPGSSCRPRRAPEDHAVQLPGLEGHRQRLSRRRADAPARSPRPASAVAGARQGVQATHGWCASKTDCSSSLKASPRRRSSARGSAVRRGDQAKVQLPGVAEQRDVEQVAGRQGADRMQFLEFARP
jgi:hypothetical protein